MPDIAFIVEGHMEQRTVQRLCPGKRVVRLLTGGKSVTMPKMAEFVGSAYRLFNNKCYPVVVLFDREDRAETAAELQRGLIDALNASGIDARQFIICVADRDIESWLLAHVDHLGIFQPLGTNVAQVDGISGQPGIERALQSIGVVYHKTTVGVDLLSKVIPSILSIKSVSFCAFRDSLLPFCRWATK